MSTSISSLSMRTTVPSTTSPCLRLRISPDCSLSSSSIVVGSGRGVDDRLGLGLGSGCCLEVVGRQSEVDPRRRRDRGVRRHRRPRAAASTPVAAPPRLPRPPGASAARLRGSSASPASRRASATGPRGCLGVRHGASAAASAARSLGGCVGRGGSSLAAALPRPRVPRRRASATACLRGCLDVTAASAAPRSPRRDCRAVGLGRRRLAASSVAGSMVAVAVSSAVMVGADGLLPVSPCCASVKVWWSPRMVSSRSRGRQSPGRTPGLPASAGRPCGWWARQTPPFRARARLRLPASSARVAYHSGTSAGPHTRSTCHGRVPTRWRRCPSCPTWTSSPTRSMRRSRAGRSWPPTWSSRS